MEIIPDSIPSELKERSNWVLWKKTREGKKPPHSAKTGKAIDITEPNVGSTFEQALNTLHKLGRFDGVGYILNGTGLVGIDIDDCLGDATVTSDAIEFLQAIGCKYIEVSPSGNGLHGLGMCEEIISAKIGKYKTAKVEVYASKRYLTITGQLYPGLSENSLLEEMPMLIDMLEQLQKEKPTQVTQDTKVTQDTQLFQYRDHQHKILDSLPEICIPPGFGTRNRTIFQLARYLKGILPNASEDDLYSILTHWFNMYVHRFRTKELEVSWADFLSSWESVTTPYGATLEAILLDPKPVPLWMSTHRFGDRGNQLLSVCSTLAEHHAPGPFFLSARQAGELINLDFSDTAKLLKRFVISGYLVVAEQGTRTRATSYFLCNQPESKN
jgi:hypothetical protein